jgi:hypothetical protein
MSACQSPSTVVNHGSAGRTVVGHRLARGPTKENLMNSNRNLSRMAAATVAAGIALSVTACGSAAGEDNDAPKAPALEQAAGTTQHGIGPRPSKDARLRCYPRIPANPDAEIPDRCFWE